MDAGIMAVVREIGNEMEGLGCVDVGIVEVIFGRMSQGCMHDEFFFFKQKTAYEVHQ